MSTFVTVPAPRNVWRVARRPDPLRVRPPLKAEDLAKATTGNRFDSPLGTYSVLYFGSDLEACYAECLARLRPDLEVVEAIKDEWEERQDFMPLGSVPADWRSRRVAAKVDLHGSLPFLDLKSPGTLGFLRTELSHVLLHLGYEDLDMAVACASDRRITRWISHWAYEAIDADGAPLFGGIRYMSRIGPQYECWAVFEDSWMEVKLLRGISERDRTLLKVAKMYDLKVF